MIQSGYSVVWSQVLCVQHQDWDSKMSGRLGTLCGEEGHHCLEEGAHQEEGNLRLIP